MNALRLPAAVLTCLALAVLASAPARAAEKDKATNKDKIVGTWEVTKAGSDLPEGSTIEFTKDGKLTIVAKIKDQSITVKGTYTIDGDKLMVVQKTPDGKELKETIIIKSLTYKKLVTVDDKKKEDEFKKK